MADQVARAHAKGIELPLVTPAQDTLLLQSFELATARRDGALVRCELTIQLPPEVYDRADAEAWFHLDPEVRGVHGDGPFLRDRFIEIDLQLATPLVGRLEDEIDEDNPYTVAGYLVTLGYREPDDPLLRTESWWAVHVKQRQDDGLKTGYATRWARQPTWGI